MSAVPHQSGSSPEPSRQEDRLRREKLRHANFRFALMFALLFAGVMPWLLLWFVMERKESSLPSGGMPFREWIKWYIGTWAIVIVLLMLLGGLSVAFNPDSPSVTGTAAPNGTLELTEIEGERFFGEAQVAAERGDQEFAAGQYRASITSFTKALRLHGEPSATLENRIAAAYDVLERYDVAIRHYSKALAIEDTALDRVNRGAAYMNNAQCVPAVFDANAALAMDPTRSPGFHSDAEAYLVLAVCNQSEGNSVAALQDLDAAIKVAEEHGYAATHLNGMTAWRDELRELTR